MRISDFFRRAVFALSAATLSVGAFAAKEGFKSLNANPGYGGSIRGTVFVTGNPNLIYLASEYGGVTKSTDAGVTWTPTNNGLKDLSLRGIAVKPSDITNMYVVSTGGAGFYKSTDSGATWVPLPTITNPGLNCRNVRGISVVNITGPNLGHIYVSTSCPQNAGLYKSENEGATWTKVNVGLLDNVSVNGIAFFGSAGATTSGVRVHSSAGVHQSVDSAAGFVGTFTSLNGAGGTALTGPLGPNVFSTAVVSSFMLAAVQGQGVFRATSGSTTWTQVLGSAGSPKALNSGISVASNIAYAVVDGEGTYSSSDFGATWTLNTAIPKHLNFLFTDPNTSTTRWAATQAGIFKSTDSGVTWTKNTAAGQPGGNLTSVQVDPTNASVLYAAGDTVYKSTDAGATWSNVGANIPHTMTNFGTMVVATGGATIYASTANGGIYKSTDGGVTWAQLPLLVTGTTGPLSARIRMALDNTGKLYATVGKFGSASTGSGAGGSYYAPQDISKFGLYSSTNGGTTWSANLFPAALGSAGSVNNISISPTDNTTMLVATGTGIYRVTSSGTNWQLTGPALFYSGSVATTGAVVASLGAGGVRYDPLNSSNVLATVYDVDVWNFATPASGFYRSKDGGGTWEPMFNSEKAGSGSSIGVVNGKSYVYLITGGHYAGSEEFDSVYKLLGSDFFTKDPRDNLSATPMSVGGTNDGHPATVSSLSFYQGKVIGAATRSLGYEALYRKNIGPDFDNDGTADVFLRNTSNGQNFVWRMRAGPGGLPIVDQQSSAFFNTVTSTWILAGYGDFNGDGNTDIWWRNTATGENFIHFMDGTLTLGSSGFFATVPLSWTLAAIADFDGDGVSDVLWRDSATGQNYIHLVNGLSAKAGSNYIATVLINWSLVGTGDFDGDGKSDILWRDSASGLNYVFLMNGASHLGTSNYILTVPNGWNVAGIADFNGDGKADILWQNPGSGGLNYIFFMDGLTRVNAGFLPTVSDANWQIKGLGDYNGDSKADILWSNSTLGIGQNYVWRMNDASNLVPDGSCGNLGCPQGYALPSAPSGWTIINK